MTLQQASAHSCSPGWDSGHPLSLLLFPLLKFSCSHKPFLFEFTINYTGSWSRSRGRRSSRCQRARRYAPSIPTCKAPRKQKKSRTPCHVMECVGMSKAAMKAKPAHAEIQVQHKLQDAHACKYTYLYGPGSVEYPF
jgi:hypothetical protein